MFEKTLSDLIRGIRANKHNEHKYINACVDEIRAELKSNDPYRKYLGVAKLTYLHMLGYDCSWAAFPILEVMAAARFAHKRCGYLAAVQTFQQDTEILMLCTNLLRKDLSASNPMEVAVALDGLAHIATPDLARDLSQDTLNLLNHSRPYVTKRAILTLYKVFLKYPDALRASFPVLKQKLEHPDPSVVSATVNVICELARKNPRSYLPLAPHMYRLLTESSNNWMLIKIAKLFAALTPLEPRLAKKLLDPITSLVQKTPAVSVLYECIHTAIIGGIVDVPTSSASPAGPDAPPPLAKLCASKLQLFIRDPDHNVRYLGLVALTELQAKYPSLVAEQRTQILKCLEDRDANICARALDLVSGLTSRRNLMDVVKRLMAQLTASSAAGPDAQGQMATGPAFTEQPAYRLRVVEQILALCSQRTFAQVVNFEWYVAVLVDLVYVSNVNVGMALRHQLTEVTVRVKSIREYALKMMVRLLADQTLIESARQPQSNAEVLYAAAWIVGEYCELQYSPITTLQYLLNPLVRQLCSPAIQTIYLQSIAKVFAFWAWQESTRVSQEAVKAQQSTRSPPSLPPESTGAWTDKAIFPSAGAEPMVEYGASRWKAFWAMMDTVADCVEQYAGGGDLEVHERAVSILALVHLVQSVRHFKPPTTSVTASPATKHEPIAVIPTRWPDLPSLCHDLYTTMVARELNPVNPRAQAKVPIPEGLDLDTPFNPQAMDALAAYQQSDCESVTRLVIQCDHEPTARERAEAHALLDQPATKGRAKHSKRRGSRSSGRRSHHSVKTLQSPPLTPVCTSDGFPILVPEDHRPSPRRHALEELRDREEQSDTLDRTDKASHRQRRQSRRNDPFYISSPPRRSQVQAEADGSDLSDVDRIPIVQLNLDDLGVVCQSDIVADRHREVARRHRRKHKHGAQAHKLIRKPSARRQLAKRSVQPHVRQPSVVFAPEEMPEGVQLSEDEALTRRSAPAAIRLPQPESADVLALHEPEVQALHSVDLTAPLESNQLYAPTPYENPDALRRKEQNEFWLQAQRRHRPASPTQAALLVSAGNSKRRSPNSDKKKAGKDSKKDRKERSKRRAKAGHQAAAAAAQPQGLPTHNASPPNPLSLDQAESTSAEDYFAQLQRHVDPTLCHDQGLRITYQPHFIQDYGGSSTGLARALSPHQGSSSSSTHKVMVNLTLYNELPRGSAQAIEQLAFDFSPTTSSSTLFTMPAPVTVVSAHPVTGTFTVPQPLTQKLAETVTWELEVHGHSGVADLHGTVSFSVGNEVREVSWQLILRPWLFMTPISRPCAPETFASIVANPVDFPYTGTTSFRLGIPPPDLLKTFPGMTVGKSPATQVLGEIGATGFTVFLDYLSRSLTGLQIVECVGTAASLYGLTVHGFQVAGLLKAHPSGLSATTLSLRPREVGQGTVDEQQPDDMAAVTLELKCSDKAFFTSLLDTLHQVFPSLPRRR
ncbi:AP-3 complex subunit delta [Dimargaris verticillata]|uniref:AP-3 complex subunit delta n=1 Tax=Dimargaris verticillata TaxID=2761393 RepID=A0A9W8EDC1_9FUNG|nr:AP-3 complex subunit delta [Dimargaris verticillata]